MKILFQGDSITDAGRDKRNYHDAGPGYPKFAVEQIKRDFPDADIEFLNLAFSGSRTAQLFERIYPDCVALKPDVVILLIGINDILQRYEKCNIATTDEQIGLNYRCILERIKNETDAKIVMLSPFFLDMPDKDHIRNDLKAVLPIIRQLADEFADVYIPFDKIFEEAVESQPTPFYYSGDATHPNENGKEFMGVIVAKAIKPLISELI